MIDWEILQSHRVNLGNGHALQRALWEALGVQLVFVNQQSFLSEDQPSLDLDLLPLNMAAQLTFENLR